MALAGVIAVAVAGASVACTATRPAAPATPSPAPRQEFDPPTVFGPAQLTLAGRTGLPAPQALDGVYGWSLTDAGLTRVDLTTGEVIVGGFPRAPLFRGLDLSRPTAIGAPEILGAPVLADLPSGRRVLAAWPVEQPGHIRRRVAFAVEVVLHQRQRFAGQRLQRQQVKAEAAVDVFQFAVEQPAQMRGVTAGPRRGDPKRAPIAVDAVDGQAQPPRAKLGAVADALRETAVAAFRALDGQGLARVDFFVGEGGEITVNEVNTMPGFTPISMFPRMWGVTGIDYPALLTTLVETAIARGTGLR